MKVLIKGAGDLATGVAQALYRAGMEIVMTEVEQPLAVRRMAALCQAVFDEEMQVEDVRGRRARTLAEALAIQKQGLVPVLIDPHLRCLAEYRPQVLVEATLCKKNTGVKRGDAPFVVAMGPGYCAGRDADVVIETMRGHDLGRLIYDGPAIPDTGVPGRVSGYTIERVLRANGTGRFRPCHQIGELVKMGEPIADCGGAEPLRAKLDGCLRGLLMPGLPVTPGMKVGDIDPQPLPDHCFTVSDKARTLGGAVLTAICQHSQRLAG